MYKRNKFCIILLVLLLSLLLISMVDTRYVFQNLTQGVGSINNRTDDLSINTSNQEYVFLAEFGKEDNYIPEMKLLASTDNGENWTENTKNLKMGQPFYLMFEASCRVPGLRLQMFGAKSITSYITIPKETIISFEITDSDTSHLSFVRDPDDPEDYDLIFFNIPTSPLDDKALARGVLPRKVSMILKCTPKQRGSQNIIVEYEDRVDSLYTEKFTLEIN
jgi:hypothetical protein